MPVEDMELARLRGAEGKRVNGLYKKFAKEYGILWNGRVYDEWASGDEINMFLSAGNSILYNVCHACILALNFSPELGFIHTGKMRSFVWDVADIYNPEIVMPAAFSAAAEHINMSEYRQCLREKMWNNRFLSRIVNDLYSLFDLKHGIDVRISVLPELWDGEKTVRGGANYG